MKREFPARYLSTSCRHVHSVCFQASLQPGLLHILCLVCSVFVPVPSNVFRGQIYFQSPQIYFRLLRSNTNQFCSICFWCAGESCLHISLSSSPVLVCPFLSFCFSCGYREVLWHLGPVKLNPFFAWGQWIRSALTQSHLDLGKSCLQIKLQTFKSPVSSPSSLPPSFVIMGYFLWAECRGNTGNCSACPRPSRQERSPPEWLFHVLSEMNEDTLRNKTNCDSVFRPPSSYCKKKSWWLPGAVHRRAAGGSFEMFV